MSWSQAELDALKSAIAKGEKRVSFGDRSVEYRSLAEMIQALGMMQAEVDAASATERPRQRYLFQSGRGL